ncbi:ABC transporter permease [Halobellus sp. Atlit-38R]|uniref:ABC transporter permease n=2 Tax=Haloferacaceae TaxID=1644056 RepID=UPI000EF198A4|nr:ABC transporter permease [Halobellus sp. Atlit-38R]RLM88547.1 ABC transporter permease [Halobellus sp. Atlit-38R]
MSQQNYDSSFAARAVSRLNRWVELYGRLDRSAQISFVLVVGVIVTAIAAPLLAPYDPAHQDYAASLSPPSVDHPLGTDLTGRDILSRLIFGARASLAVGIVAVGMAIAIGVPLGSFAGYVGGWTDEVIMRMMDMVISIPALVLGLAIVGTLGAGLINVIGVVAIVYSPQYARLIRGSVLSEKEEDYVTAAENTGLRDSALLVKHILPNAVTPVLVQATYHVATAIILEASLSFLGLGVQPPTATWGVMIASGRQYLPAEWWISTFPGFAIMITVLAFNILGDGLRDEFDPRSVTQQEGGA